MTQKLNVVTGLIHRVINLSNPMYLDKNHRVVEEILMRNNYPRNIISRFWNKMKNKLIGNGNDEEEMRPVATGDWYSMLYISGLSEKIERIIKSEMNVRVAYKNHGCLAPMYSKMKDPIPNNERKDVVYSVKWKDCDDRCYIGTTGVYIGTRMAQHKKSVEKKEAHRSALAGHT